ncbi:MAG TPA: hypothetical protein VMA13_00745 [Candidatus Saccharimonadales bacterium]|nr:hypothetical protein [Candidatus Saccharimonadales bacterium]
MNPTSTPPAARRPARRLWLWGLLATALLLFLLLGAGVAGFFCPGSDFRALRNGLIKSSGVEWRQQIALNASYPVLGAVRAGLSYVKLDPGARAALQSIQTAGVGVYQLPAGTPPPDRAAMLAAADSDMTVRGWERVVEVLDGHDLVAVYMLENNVSVHHLKCCVMVFDGKEMVLVSVQGNPEPLLKYAFDQAGLHAQAQSLAQR